MVNISKHTTDYTVNPHFFGSYTSRSLNHEEHSLENSGEEEEMQLNDHYHKTYTLLSGRQKSLHGPSPGKFNNGAHEKQHGDNNMN